ncbi:MAG: nucleotidyltransferase family protein [Candidatus Rokubacteria bacterium]|nr:nucleotidyltransferase family protein [Candidatus Rokubacteria bacterium]
MIVAIVLAAGLSRRMGEPKLLLDLHGKPVIRWAVERVMPHVDDVLVVVPPDHAAIRAALSDLAVSYTTNAHPEAGQATSIAAGVRALRPGTRAAIIVLGDQPGVPDAVFAALVATFERTARAIVAPVYRGVRGNPVLFAAETFEELAHVTGDAGARSVVAREATRVALVDIDAAMPEDVDTPEDYARLRSWGDDRSPPEPPPSAPSRGVRGRTRETRDGPR